METPPKRVLSTDLEADEADRVGLAAAMGGSTYK